MDRKELLSRKDEQSSRPPLQEDDSDSSQPPQLRASVTGVPVTPDITAHTYNSESSGDSRTANAAPLPDNPGYFHSITSRSQLAVSPDGMEEEQNPADLESPQEILRRLSLSGESLAKIREANPDLALSGNIISATFTLPHTLKYRKGSDWVRLVCFYLLELAHS